jgi:hypothetical protein
MANRYGEAALLAVKMDTHGKALSPTERWEDAVRRVYPTTPIGQKKSGPRMAFVGLCEAGLVKGIEPGVPAPSSSQASRNKAYAVQAVELLRAGTHKTVSQLWSAVSDGDATDHASQMDVVLALWKNGLIAAK